MGKDKKVDLLLRRAMKTHDDSRLPAGEDCPNEEALAGYIEGCISTEDREALEDHLVDCEACRLTMASVSQATTDAVDELVPASWLRNAKSHFRPSSRKAVGAKHESLSWLRRWFSSPRLVPAGAVLVTVGLAIMVLTSLPEKEKVKLKIATERPVASEEMLSRTSPPKSDQETLDTGPEGGFRTQGAGTPMPRTASMPESSAGAKAPAAPKVASIPKPWHAKEAAESAAPAEKQKRSAAQEVAKRKTLENIRKRYAVQQTAERKANAYRPQMAPLPVPHDMQTASGPGTVLALVSVQAGGGYDKSLLESHLLKALPQISSCFAKTRTQSRADVDLVARLLIDKDGKLFPVNKRARGPLEKCLMTYLPQGDLPKPPAGETVDLTLEFTAK